MVDQVIAVDQHVAKRDDLGMCADPAGAGGVMLSQPLDGLADDLEVALHRWRNNRSALYSASCRPAVTSTMNAAAPRMPSSSFGDRGCIHRLPRARGRLNEVRVAHGAGHHQVDRAREERFQSLLQGEVVNKELCLRTRPEFDDEVDVASVRIELSAGGRAEQVKAADAVLLAQAR